MKSIKDIIAQKKQAQTGEGWFKRSDQKKQKEEELAKEQEVTERKRQAKETQKLRELSYQMGREEHVFRRDEEGYIDGQDKHISILEKEAKEQVDKEKAFKNKKLAKLELENAKEEADKLPEKTYTDEEMIVIRNQLRKLKSPIKLFGESNHDTYQRLCTIEQDDRGGITKGQETYITKTSELKQNLSVFQQSLKDKLDEKKPIDLEIGSEKPEDHIEVRVTKSGSYLDYKKFERDCRDISRKDKSTLILKWIK